MGQRRRLDEQHAPAGLADFVLGVVQQRGADAARLAALGHGDPPEVPAAVGHGRRRVIGEAEDLPILFISDAAVPFLVGLGMVIVKHFFQRLDLHWFEHAGLLGNRQQDRRVGVAGVTYRELLARVFAIGCWLHWSLLVRK